MDREDMTEQITADVTDRDSAPRHPGSDIIMSSQNKWVSSNTEDTHLVITEEGLSNGTCEVDTVVALCCPSDSGDLTAEGDHLALSNDGMSEFSNSDLSLPEVCISTNSNTFEEDMNYEVQQAYRIFTGFLLDKHKGITSPFLYPIGHQEAQHGIGGVKGRVQSQLRQSMCLRRMEEKFINQEYETITEFVADFRLMLENCYRYHGVDHWISKQAQKLEIMLEQKLTLLSRMLREKTTLAVTSKGRFGAEEERGTGGTSTRRRSTPRSLATITVGGHESIMVQTLRLEEQQRAKEEKRQRELEKKEAEEMSAKEVEEWEQSLLSLAFPQTVETLWELPAIGHFLCLAQTALNLPEIIFFELERCLLMPRCSLLLSKIMSSLLSPPQRRATLHRRPALPYKRWESELRQRVLGWYRAIGASRDQPDRAEHLGLCHQFFSILGEVSPLEEKPFHLLPFYQRVWLLKGLCDHVYETQKDVQDAVLAQPIHECRESILGYDSKENAYIHFPHFCGADLRIYRQSPSSPPAFPFPSVWVKRVEFKPGTEDESDVLRDEGDKSDRGCYGVSMNTAETGNLGKRKRETFGIFKKENEKGEEDKKKLKLWSPKEEETSESVSSDGDSCEDSKLDLKIHANTLYLIPSPSDGGSVKMHLKQETSDVEQQSRRITIKQEQDFLLGSVRTIKAETQEPCLNVGEHSYTGRSPARSVNLASPTKPLGLKIEGGSPIQGHQRSSCFECCKKKTSNVKSKEHGFCCGTSELAAQLSSESTQISTEDTTNNKIWTKKKKRKKKRGREQLLRVKGEHKQLQHVDRMRLSPAEAAKSTLRKIGTTIKRKDKKKKHKTGKKPECSKKIKDEPSAEPSFKLVCTSLEELRELISKTEDELDDLESTKKRLGRWYYRREAVKDLHSTLIRLLNELSPWEPKLVKAHQRNRLRLKKEFDDFKKHPEYNNFVREECILSSSDDDDDDEEERDFGKEVPSLSDHYGRPEEEDLEHRVPRGLWSGASTREFMAESAGENTVTCVPPNHLKQAGTEKSPGLRQKDQTVSSNITSADSRPQSRSELIPANQSRDSAWAERVTAHASASPRSPRSPRSPILHPTIGLPKGYTPIPTLLAKSVGNKVTLMNRPADCPGVNSGDEQSKRSLVSQPTCAVANAKLSKAQSSSSGSQQNKQQIQVQGPQQTKASEQSEVATVAAVLPKSPQGKPTQTVLKNPVQVVYKVPEGLGHLVRKDSSPIKISVQPVMGQDTGEKTVQQVVILPSNLLVHKTEAKSSSLDQQQTKGTQATVSKVASPFCMSTDVPGFRIPENRIPVQQVAPLKDARTVKTPSPLVSPCLQQGALNAAGFKGPQLCSVQDSAPQDITPNTTSTTTVSNAVCTGPGKPTDLKQELKTVCIRDSQSILVTTRCGNTGIVKVQTSSDQNALGSIPTSPVITISPQFKAFLLAKASQSTSAPTQTSPSPVPAMTDISVAQAQKQVHPVLKTPSSLKNTTLTATTGSIPITGPQSQTTGSTVALSQGPSVSTGSTIASNISQPVQTAATGSHFQPSVVKNSVVVPPPSGSGFSQVATQAITTKTGVKRTTADEGSKVTKFILVTPSSSSSSNVVTSKGTPTSPKPAPSSRVMFVSHPTVTSSTTVMGSIPAPVMATCASGQVVTTLLSKAGLRPGKPVSSISLEALSKGKNISLPSGVQIQLPGKTTIGQTVGALSQSSFSKFTPGSVSSTCCPTPTTTGLVPATSLNTITSSPQLASHGCLTPSTQLQGIPSSSLMSQTSCSTSIYTAAAQSTGNVIKKDVNIPGSVLPIIAPVQTTTTVESRPARTSILTLDCQRGVGEEITFSSSSSSQFACNKTQPSLSSAPTTCTPFTTSATSTIQQRIVINTSTPLAAGTQILLNNARFVVPPQGLAPGSHVLIISSPAQQVPPASPISTGASVPCQGPSHVMVAPRAPVLPQPPARLPGVPAVSSPFVASTPAVVRPLLATTPNVMPLKLTGAPGLGSTLLPSKTNVVSALPRLPTAHAGNFAFPPVGTSTLVSPAPRLDSVPAVTSAPSFGSAQGTVRLATVTHAQEKCLSTISPVVATPLPRLSESLSLPVVPSPSAVTLPSPVVPVPAPLSSAVAPVIADTPVLHGSLPAQRVIAVTTLDLGIQPQQTAVRFEAPTTPQPQALMHSGLGNTSIKKQMSVVQTVPAGTRTQVLPTVAVPPIVSAVSRMQTLPIATVPPIESTVNTFETAPVETTPSSSTTVIITPAQTITSLKMNNTIHPPVILTNQSLGKHTLHTSALGLHTSVTPKILISPDGAVLSAVQQQVSSAELTAHPEPRDALVICTNSSTGALQTHDSSLQPSPADTK